MRIVRGQDWTVVLVLALLTGLGEEPGAAEPEGSSLAMFAEQLAAGESLAWDERFGYLPATLAQLGIDPDSQTLVFSKTSFQPRRITPERPRAIYFNDSTYVGWVQDSDLIELCAADPLVGAVFYTLEPGGAAAGAGRQPVLTRQGIRCLGCHDSMRTQGVPGFLMRSIMPTATGRFVRGGPTYVTDHTSPFGERFGGWYVTGTHGRMRHLGNAVYPQGSHVDAIDRDAGANQQQLPELVDGSAYLRPGSDLMALMVLAHETQLHNEIARVAVASQQVAAEQPGAAQTFVRQVERFVRSLLFADEPRLEDAIAGTSRYAQTFAARGPFDSQGRSLRQFDGEQFLFRYPCSFLIHSAAFAGLPDPAKAAIGQRLWQILVAGAATSPAVPRLGGEQREAVATILAETEPEFWYRYVVRRPGPREEPAE